MRNKSKIDFDMWAELAQTNPRAFEKLRTQFLTNALNRVSTRKRHKFECMQWRIDKIRQTSKTPLSACIKISQMMWTSFDELQLQYHTNHKPPPKKTATILLFK